MFTVYKQCSICTVLRFDVVTRAKVPMVVFWVAMSCSIVNNEDRGSSETLVTSYKTKRRHNTGYYNQWVHFYVVWISDLPFRTWTQNSQTPWDRIVLGKLVVVHLVKKSLAFYWTRRFITMFTRPLHHCESQIYAVDLCGMLSRSTRVERKYVYVSWNTAVSRFTAKKRHIRT
jgi:hypothetical protein